MDAMLPLIFRKWRSPLNPYLLTASKKTRRRRWCNKTKQAHVCTLVFIKWYDNNAGLTWYVKFLVSVKMNADFLPYIPCSSSYQNSAVDFPQWRALTAGSKPEPCAALPLARTQSHSKGEPIVFKTALTTVPCFFFYEWPRFIHAPKLS